MTAAGTKTSSKKDKKSRSARQTLAEWVSLAISVALLLTIATYLVIQAIRSNGSVVPVRVVPQLDQIQEVEQGHYLPIRIENRGRRSVRDVKIELTYGTSPDQREQGEIEIDYLAEGATEEVYWIFREDPRTLNVQAKATQYRLE